MNPLTALPTKIRKSIYAFYATLGIAFGAVQVGYATANADQPLWLLVAFGVFGYLGTALGLVAAANTVDLDAAIAETKSGPTGPRGHTGPMGTTLPPTDEQLDAAIERHARRSE